MPFLLLNIKLFATLQENHRRCRPFVLNARDRKGSGAMTTTFIIAKALVDVFCCFYHTISFSFFILFDVLYGKTRNKNANHRR